MRKRKQIILPIVLLLAASVVITAVLAYLTDNEKHINKITMGKVVTTITEEFDPPDPEDFEPGNTVQYKKQIQAKNTGTADAYIRIAVEFSDSRAEAESKISIDGNTWYSVADYKNHLPADWVYVNDASLGGAYFYYKKPVKAEQKNRLGIVVQQAESTPVLMKYVKTEFSEDDEAYPYDIYVYAEAVQTVSNTGEVKTGANAAVDTWRSFIQTS